MVHDEPGIDGRTPLRLVLDTSAAVSAAVLEGDRVLAAASTYAPRSHAELLAPTVRRVLAEAGAGPPDLDGIVAGIGPGPFTGLRVALVSAATMGLALRVPTHGVCSLDALALRAVHELDLPAGQFVVATDARRKEVYRARYRVDGDTAARVGDVTVTTPDRVDVTGTAGVVGRGAHLYPDHLPMVPGAGHLLDPDAAALGIVAHRELGSGTGPRPLEPLYLRRPDATPAR